MPNFDEPLPHHHLIGSGHPWYGETTVTNTFVRGPSKIPADVQDPTLSWHRDYEATNAVLELRLGQQEALGKELSALNPRDSSSSTPASPAHQVAAR